MKSVMYTFVRDRDQALLSLDEKKIRRQSEEWLDSHGFRRGFSAPDPLPEKREKFKDLAGFDPASVKTM